MRRRFRVMQASVALSTASVELLRPENPDSLITEEDYIRDERLPYWADVWPSSIILARYLETQHGAGRRLLELGCGVGLVATAAVRAGFLVTATDYYEDALDFAAVNVARNSDGRATVRMVDWRAIPDDLTGFDVVVAADVLYEARYPPLIADVLARTLGADGEGVIADPGRVAAPDLPPQCAARGLDIVSRVSMPYVDGEIRQSIDLISVRRAAKAR